MSRGLGWLQREIIDTLEEAKQQTTRYKGAGYYGGYGPGWIKCRGIDIELADHVYDLRASMIYLARKHNRISHCSYAESAFQASFSRAVRGLTKRGLLKNLDLVPVVGNLDKIHNTYDYNGPIMDLADGTFLAIWGKQKRFVVKC